MPSTAYAGSRTRFSARGPAQWPDEGMEPFGHGAVRRRHLRDLREHVAFPVRLAHTWRAARGCLPLLGALLHRGTFLGRESLGRLAGRARSGHFVAFFEGFLSAICHAPPCSERVPAARSPVHRRRLGVVPGCGSGWQQEVGSGDGRSWPRTSDPGCRDAQAFAPVRSSSLQPSVWRDSPRRVRTALNASERRALPLRAVVSRPCLGGAGRVRTR